MADWEPANEAEAAMRDALRTGDQEAYFRILSRIELLLPVSPDAAAGRAPMGWGTWASGGRTHLLAFTTPQAMANCLAEHPGSARRATYQDLANAWPNREWWLAINPGLPIEGYLPPWFVAQLARGDVRLPGRTIGARVRTEAATRVRAAASVPVRPPVPRAPAAPPASQFPVDRPPVSQPSFDRPPVERPPHDWSLADRPPVDRFPTDRPPTVRAHAVPVPSQPAADGDRPPLPRRRPASVPEQPPAVPPPAMQPVPIPDTMPAPIAAHPPFSAPVPAAAPRLMSEVRPTSEAPPPAIVTAPGPAFHPANDVEANLLAAATSGQTDNFLSTLLLAKVLLPLQSGAPESASPGDPDFEWRREEVDGRLYVVVFTSTERMAEHLPIGVAALTTKFVQLIRAWPDESWSFAVNPGTPVGATLPGGQIKALAAWAAEVGLSDEPSVEFEPAEARQAAGSTAERPLVMQKPLAPTQVAYYLDRGYDRVSGFVHRASEVAHLITPERLYAALGLGYAGSPFKPSDNEMYVLRWTAYRPNLYRIPYGGRDEPGMRAMQGWVIERGPFRGNGFAPGEGDDVIAEFKVDSARLPHNAQMWRVTSTGEEKLVALFDADGPRWYRVGSDGVSDKAVHE